MGNKKYLKGGATVPNVVPKVNPGLPEDKCVKQRDECVETCKKTAATCATKEMEENKKVSSGATGATGATGAAEVKPGLFSRFKNLFGAKKKVPAPTEKASTSTGGKRKSKHKSRRKNPMRNSRRKRKSRKN